jgi:trehalose 6-phosphate synthase
MLHGLPHLMSFRRQDLDIYRKVNRRFADALVPLLRRDDRIWVHDYHLLSLPGALRQRGVFGPTGFYLHVPFPAPEAAAVAPGIRSLVQDVLACDLLGFQTATDRDNFAATAVGFAGAVRTGDTMLELGGRPVRLGVFPAEIAAPEFAATAAAQMEAEPSRLLARSLRGQAMLLGIDRLDPTKGLPERLEAFRRVVARRPARSLTMLQIAAPSREDVAAYKRLRQEIDLAAGAINSEFGEPDWLPLRLLARPQNRDTVAGFMRLARVGLVTPIRDGMNLVAKEYIAAQDPADPGVLVLSRFAGAAAQLASALLVNPHDAEGMAEAICAALDMPLAERRARWQDAWAAIADASPEGWGENFLHALAPEALDRMPMAGTA